MRLSGRKIIRGLVLLAGVGIGIISIMVGSKFLLREKKNPNYVEVDVSNNLENQKVRIIWTSHNTSKVIFDEGKDLRRFYKKYGKNEFSIYYDDECVGQFGHFKYNNWHGHTYKIELTQDSIQGVSFDMEIIGPDDKRVWKKKGNTLPE